LPTCLLINRGGGRGGDQRGPQRGTQSEELSEETWLTETNIEEAIEETILESNAIFTAIFETIQEAIEEHRADAENAVKEDAVKEENVLTAPVLASSGLEVTTETTSTDLAAGKQAIGLHGIPFAQAEPETAAGLAMARYEHVTTAGVHQADDYIEPRDPPDPAWLTALFCKLDEDGRERQELPLPVIPTPQNLGQGQGSMIPGQQALHVARQCMQISHTDAEICQVICTLAVALGASRNRRTEAGTIKALHAVLRLLQRPEMSEEEACTSTGASTSSFKRWQKRVQSAQLGMSLP